MNHHLTISQDSNISTFSRSSVRSSKRLKGMGETGYTKPGPPTPGRNKSLGECDLHHLTDNDYDDDNYDDNDGNVGDQDHISRKLLCVVFTLNRPYHMSWLRCRRIAAW